MKIEMIGKTDGVFKVRIDSESPDIFRLYSDHSCIDANRAYIPEIIEMLKKAQEIAQKTFEQQL